MLLSSISLGTISSCRLQAAEKLVYGPQALLEATPKAGPVVRRDDARDPVRRVRLVPAHHPEGVLLFEEGFVGAAPLLLPPRGAGAFELLEDPFVDRARQAVRSEDLVGARKCALEPHKTGIILVP
jgi:hypothetical protein